MLGTTTLSSGSCGLATCLPEAVADLGWLSLIGNGCARKMLPEVEEFVDAAACGCFELESVKKTASQNVWPRINELIQNVWPRINELIRVNSLIKTARSVVLYFAASTAKFWKHDISSTSESAFPGFFGNIFGCSTPSKNRCFSTQEFTRFLSTV